jgi:hypothetical protein
MAVFPNLKLSAGPHWLTNRWFSCLRLAARADVNQTIDPRIVLLDPPGQGVFFEVNLPNVNSLINTYLDWPLMDHECLSVPTPLCLDIVDNNHRRRHNNNPSKNRAHELAPSR